MRGGRRLWLLAAVVCLAPAIARAQRVQVDNLPSHVIVDSCSGCGGGPVVTDGGSQANGQSAALGLSLAYGYDAIGAAWKRWNLFALTNANAAAVAIVDGSGNQITSFGGGTQYANGTANASPTGTLALGYDGANLRGLNTNTSGQLQVVFPSAQAVSGTVTANAGSGTFTVGGTVTSTQGTAAALASGWPVKVTDGTNTLPTGDAAARKIFVQPTDGTHTANFDASGEQTVDLTLVGGSAVVTGVGGAGAGIPRVTTSHDNAEATGTLNANGLTFSVSLAGYTGAGAYITGACTCTYTFEYSPDNGTTWSAAIMLISGVQSLGGTQTNPAGAVDENAVIGEHWTNLRLRVTAYTSGTPTVWVHATNLISPLAVGALDAGAVGSAVPFFAKVVGLKAASTTPTAATAGTTVNHYGDLGGNGFEVKPLGWTCSLQALAASLTQCQAAPAAGYSLYITSVIAISTTGTASNIALRAGTGSNCGTGTVGVFPQPGGSSPSRVLTTPINTAAPFNFTFPGSGLKLPAANALCVIGVATNTLDVAISGYIAP